MPIASDKKRTGIVLPITLIEQLTKIAKQQDRSFNNLVTRILTDYVEKMRKEGKIPDDLPIDDDSDK